MFFFWGGGDYFQIQTKNTIAIEKNVTNGLSRQKEIKIGIIFTFRYDLEINNILPTSSMVSLFN